MAMRTSRCKHLFFVCLKHAERKNNKTRLAIQGPRGTASETKQNPPCSTRWVLFEVWVSSGAMPDFKIDSSLPAFDFYEGADLTALGRPLKIDRQITPPFKIAAPLWNGLDESEMTCDSRFGKPQNFMKLGSDRNFRKTSLTTTARYSRAARMKVDQASIKSSATPLLQ